MTPLWSLVAAVLLSVPMVVPSRCAAAEFGDVEGTLSRVYDAVHQLRREARTVWTRARPVEVSVSIARSEDGRVFVIAVDTVFVTTRGIVDGRYVARGEELPEVTLVKRDGTVPNAQRLAWEQDFGVIRKFDWTHLSGDWLDVCGLPRPDDLSAGESLLFELQASRRIPVLQLRYSHGDAACRVDDRGTVYPSTDEEVID